MVLVAGVLRGEILAEKAWQQLDLAVGAHRFGLQLVLLNWVEVGFVQVDREALQRVERELLMLLEEFAEQFLISALVFAS